jgi:hypothetical protein
MLFALLLAVEHPVARPARVEVAAAYVEPADRVRALRTLVVRGARDERMLGAARALERALTTERIR